MSLINRKALAALAKINIDLTATHAQAQQLFNGTSMEEAARDQISDELEEVYEEVIFALRSLLEFVAKPANMPTPREKNKK